MKPNLKTFSLALLTLSCASLSAEREFIFSENPSHSKVVMRTVAAETPYRLLTSKDPNGFTVEMDDGSTWRVVGSDSARNVVDWRINDSLVIFRCLFPTWTGARFYVLNERLRTTANVELSFGSLVGTPTHLRVADINYSHGQILIIQGTGQTSQWLVNIDERKKLQHWKLNQTIILGFLPNSYAGWFTNSSYILINVERNEFVEANLL